MTSIELYSSFEEIIESIHQTVWEKEHNIEVSSKEIVEELSNGCLKVIKVNKSNGEIGIVLALLISKRKGFWILLYPYEESLKLFPKILDYYNEIDKRNKLI